MAGGLDRQAGHVLKIQRIRFGQPAGFFRRQGRRVAGLIHQRLEGRGLQVAQVRLQDVLGVEEDQHSRAPGGVGTDPLPLLLEMVGLQAQRGMGVLELAGAQRKEKVLQRLNSLGDAGGHPAAVHLGVDKQVLADPAGRRLPRRSLHQSVPEHRQGFHLDVAHRRSQTVDHRLSLLDSGGQFILPGATRRFAGSPGRKQGWLGRWELDRRLRQTKQVRTEDHALRQLLTPPLGEPAPLQSLDQD